MLELVSTPQEAVSSISDNVYNIKIKCLACSESKFIPYAPPIIQEGTLIIGEHSFPLNLIEMVTIRWKDKVLVRKWVGNPFKSILLPS